MNLSRLAADTPMFGANNRGIILFGFEIYYYAICIVCGMIGAAALSALLMKRRNMSSDFIFLLFVVCIPSAIVCARLFSCLTDPSIGIQNFFRFRDGGLSVTGGVLGGVLAGFIVCRLRKVSFLRAADCVVVNILIAQSLGRWGNFFNGEVYGAEVTNPALQWFPFAVPISPYASTVGGIGGFSDPSATWHYAFFFYESVLDILLFVVLFTLMWKFLKKPHGLSAGIYLAWYGIVRSIMEPLRDSEYILGHDIPISLVFAVLMAACGIILILSVLLYNRNKYGSATGAVVGEPLAILPAYYTAEQRKEMAQKAEAESSKEHAGKTDKEPPEEDGEGKDV